MLCTVFALVQVFQQGGYRAVRMLFTYIFSDLKHEIMK